MEDASLFSNDPVDGYEVQASSEAAEACEESSTVKENDSG